MRIGLNLAAAIAVCAVPARMAEPSPPAIVIEGLKAAVSSGIEQAIAVWFKGSALEGDTASAGTVIRTFHALPDWFGKPAGYELLKTYAVGTHFTRTYAVLLFDGGPMYWRFDYYLGPKGWILNHLDFNTEREKILPASLEVP